jgi:hypothetical protein
MEAPEVPIEHLHEEMHHHAEHGGEESKWIMGVALSSAIIAGLAAIASLLAGVNANEAMIDQMRSSDQWNYYQAKGVKSNVLASKMELLIALGKTPDAKDKDKIAAYKKDQEGIKARASEYEAGSREHLETHEAFARSVTMYQVAIALAAVSVLTKRRRFFLVSLGAAFIGVWFLTDGLLRIRAQKEPAEEAAEGGGGGGEEKAHAKKAAGGEEHAALPRERAGASAESATPSGQKPTGE